jgi:hypothetical protein
LAVYLLLRRRETVSGLLLAATVVAVKFLALLFVPVLVLTARRRGAWTAGLAMGLIAVIAVGFVLSADLMAPVRTEAPLYTSGNVPFVLGVFGLDLEQPAVQRALTVLVTVLVGGTALWAAQRGEPRDGAWTVHAIALVLLVFLIGSRKSFTSYLVIGFFPVCLSLAVAGIRRAGVIVFGLLGTVALVEPSIWFRWMEQRGLWTAGASAPASPLTWQGFVALDLLLLAGYGWLVVRTGRALSAHRPVPAPVAHPRLA